MIAVGKSVIGLQRKNNEDSIFVSDNDGTLKTFFIVADGMGGHKAGEVASSMAIDIFKEYIYSKADDYYRENTLDTLVEGLTKANSELYELSQKKDEYDGMGTTFTCAAIRDMTLYIVHVGDSRCYLFRNSVLKQLTRDHSFVMEMVKQGKLSLSEAQRHPKRNVITRAVGTEKRVKADTVIESLYQGDILILCTDGLTTMIDDKTIQDELSSGKNAKEMLGILIDKANENGGSDNISAVIIDLR
ncbi:MAG: Stp1/IreP family PP2C-type Ser/Thr phosphatase [Clostridia bacterium]|jgi:protein phosphatase|nr:Stp1/IreP family PP2C-type Ser/Thr phosphatase [Clostridia bacterium]MCI2013841.1 Stp1/IreP family PP2C-type Ser/Thr phosphatase [Clostridia bacterium]